MNIDSRPGHTYGRSVRDDAAATTDLSFLDSYLPYLLRRADQTLSAPFYAQLDRAGIGRSEWRVLAVLHRSGAMGVVDLAAASLSPQPTVTHAVRRLEGRNLVRRERGTHDKRQRIVVLTPAGTELASSLIDEAARLQTDALATVGDVGELLRSLGELMANVEGHVVGRTSQSGYAG